MNVRVGEGRHHGLREAAASIAIETEHFVQLRAEVVGQALAQASACAMQAHAHVLLGETEDRGRLGGRHVLEVAEEHDRAVARRELVERALDPVRELAALDVAIGIGCRSIGVAIVEIVERHDVLAQSATLERAPQADAADPARERGAVPQVLKVPVRAQPCILTRVLRLGVVLHDRAHHPEQSAVVTAHQHRKPVELAVDDVIDDFIVGVGVGVRSKGLRVHRAPV